MVLRTGVDLRRLLQHRSLLRQGRRRAFRFHLGALDAAAFSLRSIDAARLGFLFRDRAREHFHRRVIILPLSFEHHAMSIDDPWPSLVHHVPKLNWRERLYLPAIVTGMAITFRHFKNMLSGRTKVTMQYPEQKWDSNMPDHYRGAPALVRDEDGRVRCVACQLCEFICPPRAIKIIPGEIPPTTASPKSKNILRNSTST